MKKSMSRYDRQLESYRHHYYTRYGIRLDDELILMLIRISELHGDMKKELRTQPRIQFRHARDYFWYGFGQYTGFGLLLLACTAAVVWILKH
jgi:hypothetical protein